MRMKLAALTMALAALAITAAADNVDKSIRDLNDTNLNVREQAAYDLGASNDTRAVEPLIQVLDDESTTSENRPQSLLVNWVILEL
jgi:HEAT repeat protein